MRRWVLILFIVLLPWRLWAADAMALQKTGTPESPAQHTPCQMGHEAHHSAAPVTADAMHPTHHDATGDHAHHGICLLCDVCHNALGLTPQPPLTTPLSVHGNPSGRIEPVASADRQPGFKPPIG